MHDNNGNELLVRDLLKEKRADRRWRNIRFLLGFLLFAYLVVGGLSISKQASTNNLGVDDKNQKYTALIRLNGMIGPDKDFSAEETLPILRKAFADKRAEGVILDIDSPGGTPVQASIIHDAILTYKNMYHKKVVVVGEDMLTSGAYYVAVSADKIYVNPNTVTGSIGVIMKGFGFVDAIKKLGIERRVYSVGNNKDRLDPFLPQNPDDVAKVTQVEEEVHQRFIQAVKDGRQGKLKAEGNDLFNGDFWSGQTAKEYGLVDETGNLLDAMNNEFHTLRYKEYGNTSQGLWRMLGGQFSNAVDNVLMRLV